MALKAILDSTEGLDDPIKALYAEQKDGPAKGKFLLQVDGAGGYALENVNGLKTALSTERSAKEAAEAKLKDFGDLDPAAAREAIAKAEKLSALDPEKEADKIVEERVKAVAEKMKTAHGKELEALKTERDGLLKEVDQGTRLRAKGEAFDKHGVIPERRKALDAFVDRYLKTEIVDGKRVVRVLDDDGNLRVANDGSNMDAARFVEELRNDEAFSPFFKGVDKSGGGTPPGSGGAGGPGKTISRKEFEGISDPSKKMEIAKTHQITD